MFAEIPTKPLIIGNIKKDGSILLRKKFAGSPPYEETWYSFGCELNPNKRPEETFAQYIANYIGVTVSPTRRIFWDTERKADHDGATKQFIYLTLEAEYVSGDIIIPKELENVAFVPIADLAELDIVPPSAILFRHLGYIE